MRTSRPIPALAVAGLLLVGACGDDDDTGDDTGATAGAAATSAPATTRPPTSASAAGDDTAYCEAHVELEAAMSSEDPAVIEAAVAAGQAVVPVEIADALETAIATSPTEEGPPSPEFTAAYADVVGWVRDNCGFAQVSLVATDYAFGGLDTELPAGPTVVDLVNEGTEFHEIVVLRKNDGVAESFEEILALPEEEVGEKMAFLGVAIAPPGATGSAVIDLAAGEHLAICFVPTGATPEAMDAGGPPEGPPHFTHGMQQDFSVT